MTKTWFVTGASRGLGRAFVRAALDRGDRAAATARDPSTLDDLVGDPEQLLRLPLDVTESAAPQCAIDAAVDHFGGLDVVVNNAGSGDVGAVEELSDAELRSVLDVNLLGVAAVARAALPVLRAQGHGHIVNISSMGGLMALPLVGAYVASKWALEGLTETLALEVAPLGIAVTLVEPGPFATSQGGTETGRPPERAGAIDAYRPLREQQQAGGAHLPPGDPVDAARALMRIVDAPTPPSRVILGHGGLAVIEQIYAQRLAGWRDAEAFLTTSG